MSNYESRSKSIRDFFIAIFIGLLVFLIIVVPPAFYETMIHKHDLLTSTSPDGLYTLKFQQVGDPAWPFGATTVKVTVKGIKNTEKEHFKESFTSDIANDGVDVSSDNCKVTWAKKYVQIDLSGDRQSVESRVIEFDSKESSENSNHLKARSFIP